MVFFPKHYSMKHDVHLQPATSMKRAGMRGQSEIGFEEVDALE